jgi:hypothetical protein
MVSRLPVFSGKMLGGKIAPEMVLPVVVLVVLFIAVLISYPWHLLTGGSLIYLLSLRSDGRPTARMNVAHAKLLRQASPAMRHRRLNLVFRPSRLTKSVRPVSTDCSSRRCCEARTAHG